MQTTMSRRSFLRLSGFSAVGLAAVSLTACGKKPSGTGDAADPGFDMTDWEAVLAAAKGQTVSWYGWGGDEARNNWINNTLAPHLKKQYDITLDLVGMDINDILTKLSGEMQAGKEEGTIDFIWINGENFYSTKQNGYLWGPFAGVLPNFKDFINAESAEVQYDFGFPTYGYECPYGKAQMQLWADTKKVSEAEFPKTADDFLAFCKAHKGQVTYPEPGDFTGTAFMETLIANVIGQEEFTKLAKMSAEEATPEAVKAIVDPGLEYLRSLNPYLWKKGTAFPADSTLQDTMFADGELVLNMGYSAPESLVKNGTLPKSIRSFLLDGGTVGNSNFMAIAANAPHKAAALVAINEIVSPEMQLDAYRNLGTISVLDMDMISADAKAEFDDVELGLTQIPVTELLAHRVPEASGAVVPVLEELWHTEVLGK